MAAARKILDLRALLAERFPHAPAPLPGQLFTGLGALDHATNGGLTKGAITELVSPQPSAGSATLIVTLLQSATRERYFVALIDGRDSFNPEAVDAAVLRHLLWVRCRKTAEAIQAADLLLRDGNFPLVILDLVLNSAAELRKLPASNWYRLQRLVELVPSAFLVLTARSMISSAQWKLILQNRWTLPQLDLELSELPARWKIAVRRAQPNKWRHEAEIARTG